MFILISISSVRTLSTRQTMGWKYNHLFIMAAVWSASAAPSYTTVCNQEIGCETGFYCETDFTCKPCLRCQDLKRELPPTSMACVTSIFECGPCVDGLKEDRITAQCITSTEQGLPTWAIIGIVAGSLLLFILICATAAYILPTTIRAPCENQIEEASAPPPPYNTIALFPKTRPVEGTTLPSYHGAARSPKAQSFDDESLPFMEIIKNEFSSGEREPLERQAARVFIDPAYLRDPQARSLYATPVNGPTLEASAEDQEDSLHNDVTTNNRELMRVRDATVQNSIVPHTVRVGQDSHNRSQTEEDEDSTHSSFNANCAPFIFNVVNNVTTVQRNDVRI